MNSFAEPVILSLANWPFFLLDIGLLAARNMRPQGPIKVPSMFKRDHWALMRTPPTTPATSKAIPARVRGSGQWPRNQNA